MKTQTNTDALSVPLHRLVRRFEDWTSKDKSNWTRIIAMRAQGWNMKQMTTGTRLKRFTVERLLKEYRAAHTPNDKIQPTAGE
jgi:hypothetical protein